MQYLHAINRRQPSFLPCIGHDYEWHLWETLLGELSQRRDVHPIYPANSSSNAFASWRSRVSNPSVNQL